MKTTSELKKRINPRSISRTRWALFIYDVIIYAFTYCIFIFWYKGVTKLDLNALALRALIYGGCLMVVRVLAKIYKVIWRYGGVQLYIRLIISDALAYIIVYAIENLLFKNMPTILSFTIFAADLLLALVMRMSYRYIYKCGDRETAWGRFLCRILSVFALGAVKANAVNEANKIKIAVIGANATGMSLAEEMGANPASPYIVRMFIDSEIDKSGRSIRDIPVYSLEDTGEELLKKNEIQEIVFALPKAGKDQIRALHDKYVALGYKVKTYDYPVMTDGSGKRMLREFDIEDLLFRKQIEIDDEKVGAFYGDKVVLITGGGGSIGSELCRQLAKMSPKQIIIVDIYENGAYDVQQELMIKYGKDLDVRIHIVSYTNKRGLERVFRKYHPDIVINAAAHKHVPLMENDCIEAVENNVFGTLNTVELSEKYGVQRFIQVSTDKAVNPTNVMGATKRMCEFIVMAHASHNSRNSGLCTTFSATRFGNVLGSAGSVIPLFKRQIANGGPITITDKRIIRYFMTIPEASRLVLQSGAMAHNGELFVLDMGKPVKIWDMAETMVRLSGLVPGRDIELKETGLRPGEKLYEELLIQSEHLSKTENDLIFIEKDTPISIEELEKKLSILRDAASGDVEENVKAALIATVPTYRPLEVPAGKVVFNENAVNDFMDPERERDIQMLRELVGKRVLVVDDLSINREIAADTLIELGMMADTAESGEEAVEMVRNNNYDFVLMDIVMPGMSGYVAAKKIRGFNRDIPIIAISASVGDDASETALNAGMDLLLSKPLRMDELLNSFQTLSALNK